MFKFIRKFRSYLIYREAVRKAEERYSETCNRQFVMPSSDGKLFVVDRKNFRLLKRKGYLDNKMNVSDLIISSYYYTADGSGRYAIPEHEIAIRKQKFYLWREKKRKELKKKRVS